MFHAEAHDVGFDRGRVDLDAGAVGNALREQLRVGVVFNQPGAMMPQRVQRARRDNAGLPESASELLLEAPRPLDEIARAA